MKIIESRDQKSLQYLLKSKSSILYGRQGKYERKGKKNNSIAPPFQEGKVNEFEHSKLCALNGL